MSSFTDPLIYSNTGKWAGGRPVYRTLSPFRYYVGTQGSSLWVDVPAGFETDLASIPRWFRIWFSPDGCYSQMAVLHDYLYREGLVSRTLCDRIFYEAMGVPPEGQPHIGLLSRYVIYRAVRYFGWGAYGRHRKSAAALAQPKTIPQPVGQMEVKHD